MFTNDLEIQIMIIHIFLQIYNCSIYYTAVMSITITKAEIAYTAISYSEIRVDNV